MTCTVCGGDVLRIFVGTVEKYVHAVKGIDHGPLPVSDPAKPREPRTPTRPRSDETSGRSLGLTAPELPFPVRTG